ncbi:PRTRC system ParB family protein [Endozoicomonas sp. G2_2]|uniref:PRTRC system ParB family protein n=1 Tax=Endozoicomonas sp. G2_2 TaxID=2821092 RepID=UPI001AD9A834|nr:PRTRC system ParB family protein [Endozoicomonas sp. G2_2]MBO9471127.1 PRTRC system ParB family protein [Endozoicomonas sp. G2_2]
MTETTEITALDRIRVRPGHNPRRFFDDQAMKELVTSIRDNGLIQPILVRPHPDGDGYELVAGERRFRACREAGLESLPVLIRDLTLEEMTAAAVTENNEREDISAAEEARVAQRALSACDGSRAEAARLLGWSSQKLASRLALLNTNESVLQALEQRRVPLGIAELMASVPPESQDATLETIIAEGTTVDEFRAKLGSFTRELVKARFDTQNCVGCRFNSSTQKGLFDTAIDGDRCANHACWHDKTQQHIEAMRAQAAEEVPAVYLDTEKSAQERTILEVDGAQGVGSDQREKCKGCKFYGASISTVSGKAGATTYGVCFNLDCHGKMARAFRKLQAKTQDSAQTEQGAATAPAATVTSDASQAAPAAVTQKTSKVAESPKRVIEAAKSAVTKVAAVEAANRSDVTDAVSLFALIQLARDQHASVAADAAKKLLGITAVADGNEVLRRLLVADEATRSEIRQSLISGLFHREGNGETWSSTNWVAASCDVLAHADVSMTGRFVLDRAFVDTHTKSGAAALSREAGFDTFYDEKEGEGAFAKLEKGKREPLIDALVDSGFDYSQFVPSVVSNVIKTKGRK